MCIRVIDHELTTSYFRQRRANAAASKPKGALGKKLEAERKMTDNEVLKKAAAAEIRRRDGEAQVEAQAFH